MVLNIPIMDDDDDLEALRLAALQTIRPRVSRNVCPQSANDKAKFFRPSPNNPNLITIVPLDSRNKSSGRELSSNFGGPTTDAQCKLAKILPQSVYSDTKKEEKTEVSSKFSRFRDSGSHSDDDSWDDDETFTTTKVVSGKEVDKSEQSVSLEQDDVLHLDDGDEDSLEKLMDEMEEEFSRSEAKKKEEEVSSSESKDKFIDEKENIVQESVKRNGTTPKGQELTRRKSPVRVHHSPSSGEEQNSKLRVQSPLLGKRSPRRRSRSPLRRSRSPVARRSRSPVARRSRSPLARRSRSPVVRRSPRRYCSRSVSPPRRRRGRSRSGSLGRGEVEVGGGGLRRRGSLSPQPQTVAPPRSRSGRAVSPIALKKARKSSPPPSSPPSVLRPRRKSPRRSTSRSPPPKLKDGRRSPLDDLDSRRKLVIKRRSSFLKSSKNNSSKIDSCKKLKDNKKKEEKKVLNEPNKNDEPLDPVLEARRKKFESNNVVAPINKKIRLCPTNIQTTKEESTEQNNGTEKPKIEIIKKSPSAIKKRKQLSISTAKKIGDSKAMKGDDDDESVHISSNDVILLEANYSLDDLERKEKDPLSEPNDKIRKTEIKSATLVKKSGRKIILHDDRSFVQKRKISVNIKPTALLVLEEKSKKLSEHRMTLEKREKGMKGAAEKSVSPEKAPVYSEDTIGKKFQQRQLKMAKDSEMDGSIDASNSGNTVDLRAELSRRRAERLKGGIKPPSRLLQSAFEGLIGKKPVRVSRLSSPEGEAPSKKSSATTAQGRRVKVVRGESPLESGPQEIEFNTENIKEPPRNSLLNIQSGRSVLHRNQV